MSFIEEGHFILGVDKDGRCFRPSTWVDRIASAYGFFDNNRHLRYNPNILPVWHENEYCLFVAEKLTQDNPEAYQHVMAFACSNGLRVKHLGKPVVPEPPAEMSCAA